MSSDSQPLSKVESFTVEGRPASRGNEAVVVVTVGDGPAVPFPLDDARDLQHQILNEWIRLDRAKRDGALTGKVRDARRHEREQKRAAKEVAG